LVSYCYYFPAQVENIIKDIEEGKGWKERQWSWKEKEECIGTAAKDEVWKRRYSICRYSTKRLLLPVVSCHPGWSRRVLKRRGP
jgi:hypothetical protein